MPTSKRSAIPIEGVTHGLSGYAAGCGCWICAQANADSHARHMAKRRALEKIKRDAPNAGEQEKLTRLEILGLGKLTKEGESLAHLAIINAKLIDTIESEQRWHLLSTTVRTLRDLMKDLKAAVEVTNTGGISKEAEEDDFASTLRATG